MFIKALRLQMDPNFHLPYLPNPESWIKLHSHLMAARAAEPCQNQAESHYTEVGMFEFGGF